MEASQERWNTLDEYLAHFTSILLSPHLKKGRKTKSEDLLMRPRKKAEPPEMAERRKFFEDFKAKHGTPRRHR